MQANRNTTRKPVTKRTDARSKLFGVVCKCTKRPNVHKRTPASDFGKWKKSLSIACKQDRCPCRYSAHCESLKRPGNFLMSCFGFQWSSRLVTKLNKSVRLSVSSHTVERLSALHTMRPAKCLWLTDSETGAEAAPSQLCLTRSSFHGTVHETCK